jgi:hypothetical protein
MNDKKKWQDLLNTTPMPAQIHSQFPAPQSPIQTSNQRYADPNRHRLIIENLNEDYGQDDYREELTWRIEHDLACEKKAMSMLHRDQLRYEQRFVRHGMVVEEPLSEFGQQLVLYTCPLAQYIADKGRLDRYDGSTLPDISWQNLEEGRYELALAYTTSYRAWENTNPYRAQLTLVLL